MARLLSLIILGGGLAILLLQNGSPVLPLVFLGSRSLALPLGVWVVAAAIAGASTTVVINLLLRLLGETAPTSQRVWTRSPSREVEPERRYADRPVQDQAGAARQTAPKWGQAWPRDEEDPIEDWDDEEAIADSAQDFDEPADREPRADVPMPEPTPRQPSTYSYTYRDRDDSTARSKRVESVYAPPERREPAPTPNPAAGNPKAGDPKAVYDADYRLITPPTGTPSPAPFREPSQSPPSRDRDDWEASPPEDDDWI